MSERRLRQLVYVLTILLAALAVPCRVDAQIQYRLRPAPRLTGEMWPADFNRDGVTDVTFLTTPAAGLALAWAPGVGNGSFGEPQAIATGTGTPIGVGDVNGDGMQHLHRAWFRGRHPGQRRCVPLRVRARAG